MIPETGHLSRVPSGSKQDPGDYVQPKRKYIGRIIWRLVVQQKRVLDPYVILDEWQDIEKA